MHFKLRRLWKVSTFHMVARIEGFMDFLIEKCIEALKISYITRVEIIMYLFFFQMHIKKNI